MRAAQFDDEQDILDAFIACGGGADKSGNVHRETLIKIIKHDFGNVPLALYASALGPRRLIVCRLPRLRPPSVRAPPRPFSSWSRPAPRRNRADGRCPLRPVVAAGLTINIEELIDAIDTDGSGEIE